ncbi:MAG: acetyl/propionyl-CoA carboxylase alpha subunit, partial [Bacillariaceae sp.]
VNLSRSPLFNSSSFFFRNKRGKNKHKHKVTQFYDPMLSKIISYAPTRDEAIKVLSDGLDSYVIEGVRHNARLVNAVLVCSIFK